MSTYIITFTSAITGKRQVYDQFFKNKRQAKNKLVWMYDKEHFYKNPRIKRII